MPSAAFIAPANPTLRHIRIWNINRGKISETPIPLAPPIPTPTPTLHPPHHPQPSLSSPGLQWPEPFDGSLNSAAQELVIMPQLNSTLCHFKASPCTLLAVVLQTNLEYAHLISQNNNLQGFLLLFSCSLLFPFFFFLSSSIFLSFWHTRLSRPWWVSVADFWTADEFWRSVV